MKQFSSLEETGMEKEHWPIAQKWLDRGDGVAVYENQALDSSNVGHRKFCSYGSENAQLEADTPPERLPDIGGQINWPYGLIGIYHPGKE